MKKIPYIHKKSLFALFLFISAGNVQAQGLTVHGGAKLQMHGEVQLSTTNPNGHLKVETGSTLVANGTINCSGNVVNNGTFTPNESLVKLNGTSLQTVSGASGIDFYNLTLDNSAGASLTTNTGIQRLLSLQKGNLACGIRKLILRSNATRTAVVDDFSVGYTGTTTGTADAHRYFPFANLYYVASPLYGGTFNNVSCTSLRQFKESAHAWECATSPLQQGRGYWLTIPSSDAKATRYTTGTVNTGLNQLQVTKIKWGTNVLGNPYPSPIDWTKVANLASNTGKFDGIARFKRVIAAGDGITGTINATIASTGVTTNTAIPNDYLIPSLQGFFIGITTTYTSSAPFMFSMDNSVRTLGFNNNHLKEEKKWSEYIRLSIEDAQGMTDEMVIHAYPEAQEDFDFYDADNNTQNMPALYSIWKEGRYAINALPNLRYEENRSFSLGFKTKEQGIYTLRIKEILAFDDEVSILLEDKQTGVFQDVREKSEYTFASTQGTNENRFVLHINPKSSMEALKKAISIYAHANAVYVDFSKIADQDGEIALFDMIGRTMNAQKRLQGEEKSMVLTDVPEGVYVVKVKTAHHTFSQQVYITKK